MAFFGEATHFVYYTLSKLETEQLKIIGMTLQERDALLKRWPLVSEMDDDLCAQTQTLLSSMDKNRLYIVHNPRYINYKMSQMCDDPSVIDQLVKAEMLSLAAHEISHGKESGSNYIDRRYKHMTSLIAGAAAGVAAAATTDLLPAVASAGAATTIVGGMVYRHLSYRREIDAYNMGYQFHDLCYKDMTNNNGTVIDYTNGYEQAAEDHNPVTELISSYPSTKTRYDIFKETKHQCTNGNGLFKDKTPMEAFAAWQSIGSPRVRAPKH